MKYTPILELHKHIKKLPSEEVSSKKTNYLLSSFDSFDCQSDLSYMTSQNKMLNCRWLSFVVRRWSLSELDRT